MIQVGIHHSEGGIIFANFKQPNIFCIIIKLRNESIIKKNKSLKLCNLNQIWTLQTKYENKGRERKIIRNKGIHDIANKFCRI